MQITPSTLSMTVLAVTKDAVYLRLPLELQRSTDGCSCEQCKKNPDLAKWDTLVVPTTGENYSWTIHMPNGSVEGFKARMKQLGNM